MRELRKAIDISMRGPEATAAVDAFRRQLSEWQLVMPDVEPLVLDFGLGSFQDVGLIEYWIANEEEAGYCGKYLFVFDGQTCPSHRHRVKMETFFVVKGSVHMVYGDTPTEMGPGAVLRIEPWRYHSFTGLGPALLLEVSTPCVVDDNSFANTQIPIGGNFEGRETGQ